MTDQPRNIKAALTVSEWAALMRVVEGELESLTDDDWENGIGDELDAARATLARARNRARRREMVQR
jgi:hypothetical protein